MLLGGGTVSFVTPVTHTYLSALEAREEAGTPNVVAAVRAALALQIKRELGPRQIHAADTTRAHSALQRWSKCPGILIVGGDRAAVWGAERTGTVSFWVLVSGREGSSRSSERTMLHPHFVAAILNDLYGIQVRLLCGLVDGRCM